ncbi:MAG: alpha/beta hydrolase family esterase [Alphaproteobacteria bacterium]
MKDLQKLTSIEERAYVVGWSNGARMAYRLLCNASYHLAGVVAFGATFQLDDHTCPMSTPVALMHLHGEEDPASPIEGGKGRNGHAAFQSRTGSPPPPLQSVRFVAQRNGCDAMSELEFRFGETFIRCTTLTDCRASATVAYCPISNLGHNWPGARGKNVFGPSRTDISGSQASLDFFALLRQSSAKSAAP